MIRIASGFLSPHSNSYFRAWFYVVISSCLCNDLHVAGGCCGEDSARAQVKRVPECPLCWARQAKPFTCNFSGMSWVELLPHSLPYTLKSLICVNPLCPVALPGMVLFFFFLLMCLSRRKSNLPTLYLWTTFPPL